MNADEQKQQLSTTDIQNCFHKQQQQNKLIETDNTLVVTRGEVGQREGKTGKWGQVYGDRN